MQRKDWDGFLLVSNVGLAGVSTGLATTGTPGLAGLAVVFALAAVAMIALMAVGG
jgi:hypothetical protein